MISEFMLRQRDGGPERGEGERQRGREAERKEGVV
jgi:hypothetical protein